MNGTPWGYIHQKKKTEEINYKKHRLDEENKNLKRIIRKLITKQELTGSEKEFLKGLKLI
jgi:hypothetical protein